MDLIGIPFQIVIGPRSLEKGLVEFKTRSSGAKEEMSLDASVARLVNS